MELITTFNIKADQHYDTQHYHGVSLCWVAHFLLSC